MYTRMINNMFIIPNEFSTSKEIRKLIANPSCVMTEEEVIKELNL